MKLKIGKRIKSEVPPTNVFELSITYMHGDCNSYEIDEYHTSNEQIATELYIALDTICKKRYVNDEYLIKKFPKFFDDEYEGDDDYFIEIPGDCTCDFQRNTSLDDFNMVYYDIDGYKYEVKLIK